MLLTNPVIIAAIIFVLAVAGILLALRASDTTTPMHFPAPPATTGFQQNSTVTNSPAKGY